MRSTVVEGLGLAHITYPNMKLSVRVTELERDETHESGSTILDELSVSIKQKQVYWIMLPMCDSADDVKEYINMINHIDPSWLTQHGGLQIICETPLGLKNLHDMLSLKKSRELLQVEEITLDLLSVRTIYYFRSYVGRYVMLVCVIM